MESFENFSLKWNDFEGTVTQSIGHIFMEKNFFDVTLICEDNQISAHKVILASCSPFFHHILLKNPHPHPLIYLKGVKYSEIVCVLNFMYMGEVSVGKEDLNSFLKAAVDLKIKGLYERDSSEKHEKEQIFQHNKRPIVTAKEDLDTSVKALKKPKVTDPSVQTDHNLKTRPSDTGNVGAETFSDETIEGILSEVHCIQCLGTQFTEKDLRCHCGNLIHKECLEKETLSISQVFKCNACLIKTEDQEIITVEDNSQRQPPLQKIRGFNLYYAENNTRDREEAYETYCSFGEAFKEQYKVPRIPGEKEEIVDIPVEVTHNPLSCFEYVQKKNT